MDNIEERIKFLKASVALSDLVGPDELTVTVSDLSALIAQLEAANEKLAQPVVLSSSTVMSRAYVVRTIKAAGFTVEGEPAPIKYIVILQRAWCNDTGSGINYHSDLVEFDKRDKAIKYGFELQDSDDFNIGVLTNGALTSFDWMAKPLAETKDSLARIASVIGIEGNADAE